MHLAMGEAAGRQFDVRQALRCARIVAALYLPNRVPPQRLLDHLTHLEAITAGSGTATKDAVQQEQSELIGTAEAAQILNCSTSYVRRIHATLDGRRIGNGYTFNKKVVEDYAAQRLAS